MVNEPTKASSIQQPCDECLYRALSSPGNEQPAFALPPARKRTFLGALDWAIGIIAQHYTSRVNGMDDLDRVREWIESIPTPDACRAANVELRAEKENTCPQCAKPIIVDLAAWMYESDEELEDICQCPASASETVA